MSARTGEFVPSGSNTAAFVLQVRGTTNSGKSGDLSTHVAGEGCEPWGQGGDPRAEANVSVAPPSLSSLPVPSYVSFTIWPFSSPG